MAPLVRIDKVFFSYNHDWVLKDISLEIDKGDFIGLVGPNGSGKSTLLKIMLGLLRPKRGSVSLFGHELPHFHEWHRIGYVPQQIAGYDLRFPATVQEIVGLGRVSKVGLFKRLGRNDWDMVNQELEAVGMLDRKNRLLRELSGGERQRVLIARALAGESELLVLDEPTVGVDIEAQEKFYDLLEYLNKERDMTLITVTHDVGVIAEEVNKMACLNKEIVHFGDPQGCINSEAMRKLYGRTVEIIRHSHGS